MVTNEYPSPDIVQSLMQHLPAYLAAAPLLFWRINVVKKEISYFNQYYIPGLGLDTQFLLKNMDFARDTILKEDFGRFEIFIKRVHDRRPSSATFRIRNREGMILWVQAAGIPDPTMSSCCMGVLTECTSQAEDILARETPEHRLSSRLELFEHPVVLCRFKDKRVVLANSSALAFFGRSQENIKQVGLYDLLADGRPQQMDYVYENLIFSERWTGQLPFKDGDGQRILCDVSIRSLSADGENYLWTAISIPQPRIPLENTAPPSRIPASNIRRITQSGDVPAFLKALLESLPPGSPADSIMLSRIFIPENRVEVTTTTTPESSRMESYPFKGSIAENIVDFGLDYLLVEDTSRSTKPIDWALFIPKQVRSYYAQPFFEDGVLYFVLIFCSTEQARFNESSISIFKQFFPHLRERLQRFREEAG